MVAVQEGHRVRARHNDSALTARLRVRIAKELVERHVVGAIRAVGLHELRVEVALDRRLFKDCRAARLAPRGGGDRGGAELGSLRQ